MLSRLPAAVSILLLSSSLVADEIWNPVADPAAIVRAGNARFTVLTPCLIRLEWAANGKFEDRASQVFVNRHLPVPRFTSNDQSDYLSIKTDRVEIRYKKG